MEAIFQAQTLANNNEAKEDTTYPCSSTPPNLEEVETILGYEFKDKDLLEKAFTHSSWLLSAKLFCSERLEYIGDAVLNLLVTKEQFLTYPDLDPGHLTQLRAANVNTEKLARVAIKHGFHRYLRHKKPRLDEQIQEFIEVIKDYPLHSNGLIEAPKDLADIVESTIGAVYIDCGFSIDNVWKIFRTLLEPTIDPENMQKHPVTELYEFCQKQNLKVQFVDLWKESMAFNVLIDEKLAGTGICAAKKHIAQSRAAKDALNNIDLVLNSRKMQINEDATRE
ncbi:hypothetical protein RJT34_00139 [Clitoria ternatea]|uniref:RNase III domain-containing protein n=1 Tax=Clitoria ternatea TaxID=43366 RepID=A0AAN9KGD0_CLITE